MVIKKLLILPIMFLTACKRQDKDMKQEKFDQQKWATKVDLDYPYRDAMLKDLMTNQSLKKLKRDQVLNLLSEPTRTDTGYLFYNVATDRLGPLIIHSKSLVIKFHKDSSVEWVKIHQ